MGRLGRTPGRRRQGNLRRAIRGAGGVMDLFGIGLAIGVAVGILVMVWIHGKLR